MLLRKILNKGVCIMRFRNTKQKTMIFDLIEKYGHLSVEEIKEHLCNQDVSLATIYRNLTILTKEGKIKRICSDDVVKYETIKKEHFHFECKCCKKIIDIDPSLVSIIINESIAKVTNKSLFLYGVCNECKQ